MGAVNSVLTCCGPVGTVDLHPACNIDIRQWIGGGGGVQAQRCLTNG